MSIKKKYISLKYLYLTFSSIPYNKIMRFINKCEHSDVTQASILIHKVLLHVKLPSPPRCYYL